MLFAIKGQACRSVLFPYMRSSMAIYLTNGQPIWNLFKNAEVIRYKYRLRWKKCFLQCDNCLYKYKANTVTDYKFICHMSRTICNMRDLVKILLAYCCALVVQCRLPEQIASHRLDRHGSSRQILSPRKIQRMDPDVIIGKFSALIVQFNFLILNLKLIWLTYTIELFKDGFLNAQTGSCVFKFEHCVQMLLHTYCLFQRKLFEQILYVYIKYF